jgi:WD40 repeat protein
MRRTAAALLAAAAVLVAPSQASAAFPGANGELLVDTSVDPEFDGVYTQMVGSVDPATGVTNLVTEGSDPASAPDGRRIAFVRGGDIWVRDGAGNERQLAADPASDREPAWSPDGAKIVFTSERGGGANLYAVEVASDIVERLTVGGGNRQPAWSPVGDRIAFTRSTSGSGAGAPELWLMDAPGSPGASFPIDPSVQAQHLRSGSSPVWSPDGMELAFADGAVIPKNLFALPVADPSSVRALTASDAMHTSVAWSPDGGQIAFVRRNSSGGTWLNTMHLDGTGETRLSMRCCGSQFIEPSANVDWRPFATPAHNTPVGAQVSVSLPGVTVTFTEVTAAGDTSVVSSTNGPAPPAGFLLLGSYHEISTTAAYRGKVTVCIASSDPQARLVHFENGAWVDVTSVRNATHVCGEVGSLSPFALFVPSDTTPPLLDLPGDIVVDATGPAGAMVGYRVTSSDNRDPSPAVSCTPPPGATFPIGQTTVACTATDAAGNSADGSFTVTVRGASAQSVALIDKTLAYLELPALEAALKARLEAAAAALIANNKSAACRALTLYIAAVRLAPSSALTAAEKTELVADATRIKGVIGCA